MASSGHASCRRLAAVGLLAGAVMAGTSAAPLPAAAHDRLLSSEPAAGADLTAPPEVMTLTYSADVAEGYVQAAATPPGGEAVPLQPEAFTASGPVLTVDLSGVTTDAAAGTWAVVIRIVSTDGHPVEDEIRFAAGPAAPAAAPTEENGQAPAPTSDAPTSDTADDRESSAAGSIPEVSSGPAELQVGGGTAAGGPWALVVAAAAVAALAAGIVLAVRRR
ncbi:MAG: copper resistance protein CopC [Kineosporiaceae bacterium]